MPGLEDDGEDGKVVELAEGVGVVVGQSEVMDEEDEEFHEVRS